jgi:hypothetical protein
MKKQKMKKTRLAKKSTVLEASGWQSHNTLAEILFSQGLEIGVPKK